MTCKGVETRLGAYLDGELSAPEFSSIRRHVLQCPSCAALLEEERRIKLALANLNLMCPSAEFEDRLVKRVMGDAVARRSLHTRGAVAVVALAAVLVAFIFVSKSQDAKAAEADKVLAERSQRMFEIERHQSDLQASDPLSAGSGIILVNHEH